MRRTSEAVQLTSFAFEFGPRSVKGISPIGFIIRGSVKSKRLSRATLVFSGVGRPGGFKFKIGSAIASDGLGEPAGLSCAATVGASNKATKAIEKNARRECLPVNIDPPIS